MKTVTLHNASFQLYLTEPTGEKNVTGNDSIGYSGIDADRRNTGVATQQGVGIWPHWWAWVNLDRRTYSGTDGTFVIPAKLSEYIRYAVSNNSKSSARQGARKILARRICLICKR